MKYPDNSKEAIVVKMIGACRTAQEGAEALINIKLEDRTTRAYSFLHLFLHARDRFLADWFDIPIGLFEWRLRSQRGDNVERMIRLYNYRDIEIVVWRNGGAEPDRSPEIPKDLAVFLTRSESLKLNVRTAGKGSVGSLDSCIHALGLLRDNLLPAVEAEEVIEAPVETEEPPEDQVEKPVLTIRSEEREVSLDGKRVNLRSPKYDKIAALKFMLDEQQRVDRPIESFKISKAAMPDNSTGKPPRVYHLFVRTEIMDILESKGKGWYRLDVDLKKSLAT